MSLLISGATIIDGMTEKPVEGRAIWIERGRIKAIGARDELDVPPGIANFDAHGKYVIPGLMNANVHLLCDVHLENLARYTDRFEELIEEAAQVALKNGLTTVFDTWGPRRFLMAVRNRINAGQISGSRIFCAGNIIGFDGPFSPEYEFFGKTYEVASAALTKRINAIWTENVGRHLMWLPPDGVATEVRAYIGKGVDFIKYASNEHSLSNPGAGAYLTFSPQVQAAIVDEAHGAGLTAQAHTMSVEGLRVAIEAGCDLIQHLNLTGPVQIPEATLDLLARRKTGAVAFPLTQEHFSKWPTVWPAADNNVRNLIRSGATLLLGNDGYLFAPEWTSNPQGDEKKRDLMSLDTGHFIWFEAMEEKGCGPMAMLKAATSNIAVAYGKDKDLGTLESGKIADMVILNKNPLEAAENYRSIHMVLKDGAFVNRDALPVNPILTKPMAPPVEEEVSFVPFLANR